YMLGQGANFLGHVPEVVLDAAYAAAGNGLICGGQHEYEIRASEAVCEAVGWADMVRFGVTGTEAVQAALRLARAVTGRTKVLRFEGHYHGWLDNVLMAEHDGSWGTASKGQLESHLTDFITLPWNDADAITELFRREGERIAAVIMEPIMINNGVIEPVTGYLEWVRRQCCRYGIVLIFDEIISGFRVGVGGAAARFGVTPDLATYGKAMGGGFPVSAVAGKADLMRRFGTGEVNQAGTFNGWIPGMAAVIATLAQLRDSAPYVAITEHGNQLMAGIRDLGAAHDLPLRVAGLPMAFHVSFG
ncbi:MAG: aminotransferase class III-fold pyridoxal phosphate-dependent enzyme, partial [Actinophytocola sp.]|nr:aminotransferase class III-fold pyridoxal phosphate-dependent enzyme [Actinophytocola sp.]